MSDDWEKELGLDGDDWEKELGLADGAPEAAPSSPGEADAVAPSEHEVSPSSGVRTGDAYDASYGALNGLYGNWLDEAADRLVPASEALYGLGEKLGVAPSPQGKVVSGRGVVNPFEDASHSTAGRAGEIAGNVASGVATGLATGGASTAARMAAAAGTSALSGAGARVGEDKADPWRVLIDSVLGAGGEGVGTLVGKGVSRMLPAKPAASASPGVTRLADDLVGAMPPSKGAAGPSAASVSGSAPYEPEIGKYAGTAESADWSASAPSSYEAHAAYEPEIGKYAGTAEGPDWSKQPVHSYEAPAAYEPDVARPRRGAGPADPIELVPSEARTADPVDAEIDRAIEAYRSGTKPVVHSRGVGGKVVTSGDPLDDIINAMVGAKSKPAAAAKIDPAPAMSRFEGPYAVGPEWSARGPVVRPQPASPSPAVRQVRRGVVAVEPIDLGPTPSPIGAPPRRGVGAIEPIDIGSAPSPIARTAPAPRSDAIDISGISSEPATIYSQGGYGGEVPERLRSSVEAEIARRGRGGIGEEEAAQIVNGLIGGNSITKLRSASKILGKMLGGGKPDVPAAMSASRAVGQGVTRPATTAFARPDIPTLSWAMQSVNTSGSGLPPDAQASFDKLLLNGDDDAIAAEYMKYSMKYPEFQRKMVQELESLKDG